MPASCDGRKLPHMQHSSTLADDAARLHELIGDIRVAMLTTIGRGLHAGEEGFHTRPMYTLHPAPGEDLLFFADATSGKVAEIRADDHVLATYSDPTHNRYVAVTGRGSIEHDAAKARELWSIHARAWFPDGPEDPRLVIIRMCPEQGEYWDGPSRMAYSLKLIKAAVTNATPNVRGAHGIVRME